MAVARTCMEDPVLWNGESHVGFARQVQPTLIRRAFGRFDSVFAPGAVMQPAYRADALP